MTAMVDSSAVSTSGPGAAWRPQWERMRSCGWIGWHADERHTGRTCYLANDRHRPDRGGLTRARSAHIAAQPRRRCGAAERPVQRDEPHAILEPTEVGRRIDVALVLAYA